MDLGVLHKFLATLLDLTKTRKICRSICEMLAREPRSVGYDCCDVFNKYINEGSPLSEAKDRLVPEAAKTGNGATDREFAFIGEALGCRQFKSCQWVYALSLVGLPSNVEAHM